MFQVFCKNVLHRSICFVTSQLIRTFAKYCPNEPPSFALGLEWTWWVKIGINWWRLHLNSKLTDCQKRLIFRSRPVATWEQRLWRRWDRGLAPHTVQHDTLGRLLPTTTIKYCLITTTTAYYLLPNITTISIFNRHYSHYYHSYCPLHTCCSGALRTIPRAPSVLHVGRLPHILFSAAGVPQMFWPSFAPSPMQDSL